MRDHDPRNASFESDDPCEVESSRNIEEEEHRYSRPSLRYIDVHDRPTFVP